MTRPLPQRDVTVRVDRKGPPRFSAVERRALASVKDEALRRTLAEILIASRHNQENFHELEQWFPVTIPRDSFRSLFLPFVENSEEAEWTELESFDSERFAREGDLLRVDIWVAHTAGKEGGTGGGSVGPQGEKGEKGADGAEGKEGKEGPAGEDGAPGVPGEKGAAGEKGEKGSAGEKGEKGVAGEKGTAGEKGDVGEKGSAGEKGAVGEKGAAGEKGEKGSTGAEGRWPALHYTYLTNTEETEPAAGNLKLNKAPASIAEATSLRINETDGDGGGIAAYLATWDDSTNTPRGYITLRKVGTPATFAVLSVTGALVDKGNWDTLVIAHIAHGGAFANGDAITVEFDRVGDKGPSELAEEADLPWTLGGNVKEKLKGFVSGTTSVIEMLANVDKGRARGLAEMVAQSGAGAVAAFAASAEEAQQRVFAEVAGISKTLLDSAGKSDWLQLAEREKARLLFGRVTSAGAKVNGSGGWTVAKTATGTYKITFTTAFAETPSFAAFSESKTAILPYHAVVLGAESYEFVCYNPDTNTVEDCAFSFTVVGR